MRTDEKKKFFMKFFYETIIKSGMIFSGKIYDFQLRLLYFFGAGHNLMYPKLLKKCTKNSKQPKNTC